MRLVQQKTSGLTTLWAKNAVSPAEPLPSPYPPTSPRHRFVFCTFPSPSSAPSRLSASILCCLPASILCCLPVSILCRLPVSILCAFHIPNPPISLSTHLTPLPPRPLSPRIHHLTNHPLARAKTSGLTTLWAKNAVSPGENHLTNNITDRKCD